MSIIQQNGGTILIRASQSSGDIEYYNNTNVWTPVLDGGWPLLITNTNPVSGNTLKVIFTTNITLSVTNGINKYFRCNSNYIQFGSDTLNPDGLRPTITIAGITNYPGLILNYRSVTGTSYSYINIFNLVVNSSSSTLTDSEGWVGQRQFGAGGGTNNYIINCHSNGDIGNNAGGIVGDLAVLNGGSLYIIGCSSSGSIGEAAGGIIGEEPGRNGGIVYIESCWSEGIINGGGGIVGSNSYRVEIQDCYSTGPLNGPNSGGIVGSNAGYSLATILNCYSIGDIVGGNSGGICGSLSPGQPSEICTVTITNCYSTGNINNPFPSNAGGGGICGVLLPFGGGATNITINNCYVTGSVVSPTGYFIGNDIVVDGSGFGFSITDSYSEAFNNDSGWDIGNANNTLTGTPNNGYPSTWITIAQGDPYQLFNMGYTPYSTTNISQSLNLINLIRTSSATVTVGNSTNSGIKPAFYGFLEDYLPLSISMDNAGAISTTTSTVPGVYTLYVYNTGSYNVTTFTLTVLDIVPVLSLPTSVPPCCQPNVCNANPQETNYNNSVVVVKKGGKAIARSVDDLYAGVATNTRTAYSQPVFKSYHDYMMYLQSKYK
jgi:hypothetical protein